MIHLIRHADAGRRGDHDPDRDRPLSPHGRRQADVIATRLSANGIDRILSSPFARCVQTVAPLARVTGVPIEEHVELAEGGKPALVIALLKPRTAICSHGDVLTGLVPRLSQMGAALDPAFPKGAVWQLTLAGNSVQSTRYHPPD